MADYLSFVGRIPISDAESSDSDEELNVANLTLDEEESEVHFNNPSTESENLPTAPILDLEVLRKCPRDVAPDEEELIEGSSLFMKRPRILGCPDMKKWLIKNKKPASLQDPDIRDHCAESLRFPPDVEKWAEYGKDDLPDAILGHFSRGEVSCTFFPFLLA